MIDLIFVTVQFEHVNSGPGTFAGYIFEAFGSHTDIRLTVVTEDVKDPAAYRGRVVKVPLSSLKVLRTRIFKGWFYRQAVLGVSKRLTAPGTHQVPTVLWYNTSPLVSIYHPGDRIGHRRGSWRVRRQQDRRFQTSAGLGRIPAAFMISDDNNVSLRRTPIRHLLNTPGDLKRKLLSLFEGRSLRKADYVIANSNYLRDHCLDTYNLDPERVRVLYKAVDLSFFSYREPSGTFDIALPRAENGSRKPCPDVAAAAVADTEAIGESVSVNRPLRVLFVKRDYLRGGLHTVLRGLRKAAEKLPIGVELTVAGPAQAEAASIGAMVAESGFDGSVKIRGRLSKTDLAELYHQNDLLCVLSKKEALGVVFLEAMSSGLPVIGTPVGGIPEVLRGGECGKMVPPEDPDALARAVAEFVVNDQGRMDMVARARRQSEEFSLQRMFFEFEKMVKEMAGA